MQSDCGPTLAHVCWTTGNKAQRKTKEFSKDEANFKMSARSAHWLTWSSYICGNIAACSVVLLWGIEIGVYFFLNLLFLMRLVQLGSNLCFLFFRLDQSATSTVIFSISIWLQKHCIEMMSANYDREFEEVMVVQLLIHFQTSMVAPLKFGMDNQFHPTLYSWSILVKKKKKKRGLLSCDVLGPNKPGITFKCVAEHLWLSMASANERGPWIYNAFCNWLRTG